MSAPNDKRYAAEPKAAAPGPAAPPPVPSAPPAIPPATPPTRGSVFQSTSLYYPIWKQPATAWGAVFGYLFWGAAALFGLLLILTVIHFTIYPIFSFYDNDDGFIRVPTSSDKQMSFSGVIASPDISANFVSVPPCGCTIGMDVYLTGAFQTTRVPRVILYRAVRTPIVPPIEDTPRDFITRYPATNLLLWLDPNKSDLVASVIVQPPSGEKQVAFSRPIENVPIRRVFRVTVIFTQMFLEIYIDGQLRQSMPLQNPPVETPKDNCYFFTTIAPARANVQTANLAFWPRALTAREVRSNGAPMAALTLFTEPQKKA